MSGLISACTVSVWLMKICCSLYPWSLCPPFFVFFLKSGEKFPLFCYGNSKENRFGSKAKEPHWLHVVGGTGRGDTRASSGKCPTTAVLLLPSGQIRVLCQPGLLLPRRVLVLGAWGGKPSLQECILQENRSQGSVLYSSKRCIFSPFCGATL